jgi:uncharacterized Tic20 family protein
MNDVILADKDRNLAVLAHLSGLAGYLTLGAGIVVPVVLWLALTDRPAVSRIALQALLLNLAVAASSVIVFFLFISVIGIPVAWLIGILATPIAIALPIIGAIKAAQGEVYRYPLIGAVL